MNDLTKPQMVLLVLLVSFVTSLTTVVVTVSVLQGVPQPAPETILQRVIQRVAEKAPRVGEDDNVIVIKEEDLVVEVAEKVSPAVVSIIATKDLPLVQQVFGDTFGDDGFFRQFFGSPPGSSVPDSRNDSGETAPQEIGRGSGFLVSEDGLLITNRHVVADNEATYSVILNTGKTHEAKVLARDSVHDIAVVKIEGGPFPTVALGDSQKIRVGQTVVAIGNALGQFDNTVSVGVISGKERTLTAFGPLRGESSGELQHVLQTDAAINPGNSGGPLLNTEGEVIGVNTAIVSGAENIGFAIPVQIVKRDIEQVKRLGRIVYPFLGVRYIVVTEEVRKERNLDVSLGVLLVGEEGNSAIVPHSPAENVGLRDGDVITHVDGTALTQALSLAEHVQMKNIGDTVILTVRRDGRDMSFVVTLAERP